MSTYTEQTHVRQHATSHRVSPLIVICCLLFVALGAHADSLRWLSTDYDFGSFREADGRRAGSVQCINEGTVPTIISMVRPTCGCTVANYTQGEIQPGDTATVWFDYNPAGRPGRFEKHIKVYTGPERDLTTITIHGTVIGTPASLASRYPVEAGALRLSDTRIPLGEVTQGHARHEYIYGYNQGNDTIEITWDKPDPSLSLGISGRKVAPGDIFTLSAYFNSRDLAEAGTVSLPVNLRAGKDDITIYVTAHVVPAQPRYTEQQLRDAPAALVYPTIIDLGDVFTGSDKRKVEFAVKNEGKTPLHTSRIHSPAGSGLLKVKSLPGKLKPDAVGTVKAVADLSAVPAGPFKLPVEVVSDDPLHPTRTIYLIGTKQ